MIVKMFFKNGTILKIPEVIILCQVYLIFDYILVILHFVITISRFV